MTPRRLLATDLDGTFIGEDRAMQDLWRDLELHGITVAFSTGRHLASIDEFYREQATSRRANACVCMVGTEIWHLEGDGYRRDEGWDEVIAEDWDKEEVEQILQTIPEAELQPMEWQSPFKSSYFLEADAEARIEQIRERLDRDGLRAKIVYSAGRYLDLLPFRSGKGEAVRYLAARLDIPPARVMTAGDTGNDLDMMRPELEFRSVVVSNATPELRNYDSPHVYQAQRPFAAGIREGLVHFGWLEGEP